MELLLLLVIKAIPVKVFGKWGVGKRTFFQKGFFPTKQFCNTHFDFLTIFAVIRSNYLTIEIFLPLLRADLCAASQSSRLRRPSTAFNGRLESTLLACLVISA